MMSRAKPLSLSLIKNITRNQFGGYSVQHFWNYFFINNFPTTVIKAYIMCTWSDIEHTFNPIYKLISPSGSELFSTEDELGGDSEDSRWNFICSYVPVFFWIREIGTHYLQVWISDDLLKQIPISVKIDALQPNDEEVPLSLKSFVLGQDGRLNRNFEFEIDNILTSTGLYNNGKFAYLMTWNNVLEPFEVEVELQGYEGNIVDTTISKIDKEHLPSYSVLHKQYLDIPSGLYWIVVKQNGIEELKHPILLFE